MPSQTSRAKYGLSSGWIAQNAVAFNDGVTFARYNAVPTTDSTPYLIAYGFDFAIPSTTNVTAITTSFQRQLIVPSASTFGSQLPYLPTGAAALSPQYTYIPSVTPVVYTVSVQLWTGTFIGGSFNPMHQWGSDLAIDTTNLTVSLPASLVNQPGFGFGVAARADVDPVILYAQDFCMTVFYD